MRPGSITTVNHTFTMKSAESCIKTIEVWKEFKKQYAKTREETSYINKFICYKYKTLLLIDTKNKNSELYQLYIANKENWMIGYKNHYQSAFSFSIVDYIRHLLILYCPKLYIYTIPHEVKKIILRKK